MPTLAKEAFTKAFKLGILKTNLTDLLEIKKHRKQKRDALSRTEQAKLIAELRLNTRYGQPLLFLLMTGLRPSELLRLKKSDFNFEDKIIHIRGTKTENADRYIPLPRVFEDLQNMDFDRFCKNSTKTLNAELKAACKNCGIKEYTLYNLRHTYATRLYEAKIPDKLIQTWMGHYSIDFTASTYVHLSIEYISEESQKLDALFDPKIDPYFDPSF